MSTPPSEVTADAQVKSQTGNIDDQNPSIENSLTSLSSLSKDGTRSTSWVPVYTGGLRGQRDANDSDDIPEPWMETVTPGKFDRFQKVIYDIIEMIVKQSAYQKHPFTMKWNELKRRPRTPMTGTITWRNVKMILGVKDLFEYKEFLRQCPNLPNYIRIQPSLTTNRGFDFGVYDYSNLLNDGDYPPRPAENSTDIPTTPEPKPTSHHPPAVTPRNQIQELPNNDKSEDSQPAQAPQLPPLTQFSEETDESYVEVQNDAVNTKLTPKQDNTSLKNTDAVQVSTRTNDSLTLPRDIAYTNDDISGFSNVHYRLFDCVMIWMTEEDAKKSPFYTKWQKALYEGFTGLTKWVRVAKLFKLDYLQDYVTLMYECPKIRERYELVWNYFDNSISYKELALPEPVEIKNDVNKLNALYAQMKNMAYSFDSTMQHVSKRMDDINTSLTGCERGIVEQLNRVSDRLAMKVSHHMNSLSDYANSAMEKFTAQATNITDTSITAIKTMFDTAERKHQEKLAAETTQLELQFERRLTKAIDQVTKQFDARFEQRLEEALEYAIETALQEINTTADEVAEGLHEQAQQILQQMKNDRSDYKTAPAKPSKLFPNVDVSAFNKPMPQYRAHQSVSISDSKTQPDYKHEWGKNGPGTTIEDDVDSKALPYPSYMKPEGLPAVDNHSIQKRIHIPYSGREQSYTWYLQIKSSLQQYGVYLISGEEFKKNKSLCPMEVNGLPISESRYHDMKTTLYHFLAQRTIVPPEFTDVRNIINRNAIQTDGYRVLYDIMKKIHPQLNPDNKFDAPSSADYADIHEYSLYLTSYFMHEQYLGRNYAPREQVNKFINGLDKTYKYAIGKLKGRMESWSQNDPYIPEGLEMDNLPLLVDEYMEEAAEAGNFPVIHRFESRKAGGRDSKGEGPRDRKSATDTNERKYVDEQCPLCQSYGHHKSQCDRMALYLNLTEGMKMMDDKLKAKIQSNYAALDAKRRTKKLAKLRGTVRQLFQAGDYMEGEKLIEKFIGSSNQPISITDSSDSEASASS